MSHFYVNFKKQVVFLISLLFLVSSFSFGQSLDSLGPAKLEKLDPADLTGFMNLIQNRASKEEQMNYLQDWGKRNPDNADLLFCYSNYYLNLTQEDFANFETSISYLKKAVNLYPDRADLWCYLILSYSLIMDYNNVEKYAKEFLSQINVNGNNWYVSHNNRIKAETYEEKSANIYSMIFGITNQLTEMNPSYESFVCAQNIWKELLKYTPDNNFIYNHLGILLTYTNPSEAFIYLEKLHELDPNDLDIIFNLCICSLYANDTERLNKYSDILNKSGDTEIINSFEESKKEFEEMMKNN